jgi:hypothetical protein
MKAKKIIYLGLILLFALTILNLILFSDDIIITHTGTGRVSTTANDAGGLVITGCDHSTTTACSVTIKQSV